MKIGLCLSLGSVFTSPAFATYSRVESMGKSAVFFMDDVSIFDNPANMNIFPNFLIGELGTYHEPISGVSDSASTKATNQDPLNPWFGGIFSYSLAKKSDGGNLYPRVSIGGAFNRKDEELFSLLPDSADHKPVPEPVTNFDGFLGLTLSNGGMLGSHIYIANQSGANFQNGKKVGEPDGDINAQIMKADLGMNWPLARNIDGELSFGTAWIGYGPTNIDAEWSYFVRGRAFSTLEIINGELVPTFSFNAIQTPGHAMNKLHFGLGVNVSLDRGFFWLGVQGLFEEDKKTGMSMQNGKMTYSSNDNRSFKEDNRGTLVSFGIERNIWWDWLVLRVGGQKEISYREGSGNTGDKSFGYLYTNPSSDGLTDDHVGFGIGINVEEKLKVDASLSEDILYTFGNLFSGPKHHIISRISATYSF